MNLYKHIRIVVLYIQDIVNLKNPFDVNIFNIINFIN